MRETGQEGNSGGRERHQAEARRERKDTSQEQGLMEWKQRVASPCDGGFKACCCHRAEMTCVTKFPEGPSVSSRW